MAEVTTNSGGLTAAEQAYMASGGADATALIEENKAPITEQPQPEVKTDPEPQPDTGKPAAVATPEQPEPGEEEIAAPDGKTKRRVVDSRALKVEREARKAAEKERDTEREMRARVDERLKLISEAMASPPPDATQEPEAPPDPEQDIFAHAAYLTKQIEDLKGQLGQVNERSNEERTQAQVIGTYRADAGAFQRQQADFGDAYNYLFNLRKTQLELQGYQPQEVARHLYTEEMGLVQRSLQIGKSPSQQIYDLAKSMGYRLASAAPAAAAATPADTAPGAAPAKPIPASVTDEIDRIKAGQAASRSLSNGSGGAGEELSLEWLANAPQGEFERFMANEANREKVERALGKR